MSHYDENGNLIWTENDTLVARMKYWEEERREREAAEEEDKKAYREKLRSILLVRPRHD